MTSPRVALAYSGGLDTSAAVAWLSDSGWDVVAVIVDVGQPDRLHTAAERARASGAVDALVVDARQIFVEGYVLPAIAMNGLYQSRYPLISALSRPLIAKAVVDVARASGATAVAHGCTGKGNDQVRFETSFAVLAPDLEVLAPVRDWGMDRQQTISYAREHGIEVEATSRSPYSIDENLWGRSIECGILEDPWASPPEDVFKLTSSPEHAPSSAREIEISFELGVPVAVDGEDLDPLNLIANVGKAAGEYGYGRIDVVEDRVVGIKSREVYEAPAALTLLLAHADLESTTLDPRLLREKRKLEAVWGESCYEGWWFSPLREAIDAFCADSQRSVTGDIRLRLSAGGCNVVGRRSPRSLYNRGLATYEGEDSFEHSDAVGFIRLSSLPLRTWATTSGPG